MIVPSHNGARFLRELLPSLRRQTMEHEVVVVDNGSTDETRSLLARDFPWVRLVALPVNTGFGRAINAGVGSTASERLVFLNNDVVCPSDFLERLLERLEPGLGVTMVAGVLLEERSPSRIDTAGLELDRTLFAFDYLHGYPVDVLERDVPDPVGPCAGAAAFDRAAFEAAGGFDEHFFAYLEDVDLTVRLLARGGRCRLAPAARALHRHSATLGSGSARKNRLMGWSRGYTLGKYRLHRQPRLFARALVAELAIVAGQAAIDRTWSGLPARLRGFHAGLRAEPEALPALPRESIELTLPAVLRRRLARRRPSAERAPVG